MNHNQCRCQQCEGSNYLPSLAELRYSQEEQNNRFLSEYHAQQDRVRAYALEQIRRRPSVMCPYCGVNAPVGYDMFFGLEYTCFNCGAQDEVAPLPPQTPVRVYYDEAGNVIGAEEECDQWDLL